MKTQRYNPSPLEVTIAQAISNLQTQIQEQLSGNAIVSIKSDMDADNPQLNFILQDKDGDQHEVVVKIIQRIDRIE